MKSWQKRGSIRRRWLRSKRYGLDVSGFRTVAQNFIARGIAKRFYSTWPLLKLLMEKKEDAKP